MWPSTTTGRTYCLILNPDQTNVHITKEEQEQEKERKRDQTNIAQLLHLKISRHPSDHQAQPSSVASLAPSLILTPLLPHCLHPQLIQPPTQELRHYKPQTKSMEGAVPPLQTCTTARGFSTQE